MHRVSQVRFESQFLKRPDDEEIIRQRTSTISSQSTRSPLTVTTLLCPQEGASVGFHEYSYQIGEKMILNNVSGSFRAGRITAIMGPSGSGKTSLIETLTGSNLGSDKSVISFTSLTLNGASCSRDNIAAISGFVPQDDIYIATMKVWEAVAMSAHLRLPSRISDVERRKRTEEALAILNLTKCADTQIGGVFGRGISGGEMRRVSIARELIADPPIIFLDEPTTGLDSFTALTVITELKKLAKDGRTIVMTIHQPSSEIFQLIDDLALMVGGRVLYWGVAKKAVGYFEKHGYHCPEFANPSDFIFMNVLRPFDIEGYDYQGSKGPPAEERLETLHVKWQESPAYMRLVARIAPSSSSTFPETVPLLEKAPFMKQMLFLYKQFLVTSLRSPTSIPLQVVFSTYSGLMVGLTYLLLRSDDFQEQIRGRTGAISFLMTTTFTGGTLGCIQVMWEDRAVFMRDYRSHYYDVTPAYFAKMMVAMPVDFMGGMLVVLISYYMIGLNPSFSAYLFTALLGGLNHVVGLLAGCTVGYTFADPRRLIPSAIIFILPFMIFGGLLIAPPSIPPFLRWLVYLDPIYYAFTAAMQIAYNPCPDAESATESNPVFPCQRTVALGLYGIDDALPAGVNLVLLLTLVAALFTLGWISLYFNAKYRGK